MPNLIHSLDATTLALLVNDYFESDFCIKNIYTIHDCFAMPINHIEYIIDLLKMNYIKLYSQEKYLRKLDQGIINNIKNIFGDSCFDEKAKKIYTNNKVIVYPDIELVLGKNLDFHSLNRSSYLIK